MIVDRVIVICEVLVRLMIRWRDVIGIAEFAADIRGVCFYSKTDSNVGFANRDFTSLSLEKIEAQK